MLLNKFITSIIQGADLFEKDFKQYIKESLDNSFYRQNLTGVGGMCKILLFITDIQKEQNKKPLIISGHSYKPKLFFFLITLPAKIFRAKSHKNNKTKFVWNNALTL